MLRLSSCLCPISLGLLWGDLGRYQCSDLSCWRTTHLHGALVPGQAVLPGQPPCSRMGGSAANSLGRFTALPQFPQAPPVPLAALRGRAEICPQISHDRTGIHVLCPHAATPGGASPCCAPLGALPSVCPGRKWLKCPDFLSAMLEGKVTCRSDWREG